MSHSNISSPYVDEYLDATNTTPLYEGEQLPLLSRLPAEYLDIAERLQNLPVYSAVKMFTATNMQSERTAFLDAYAVGQPRLPAFEYSDAAGIDVTEAHALIDALWREVGSLPRDDGNQLQQLACVTLKNVLRNKRALLRLIDGIQKRDDRAIGTALLAMYPGTDDALCAFADAEFDRRVAGQKEPDGKGLFIEEERTYLEGQKFGPEGQREAVVWALRQLGLYKPDSGRGYDVRIDDATTTMHVSDKPEDRVVLIPSDPNETLNGVDLCGYLDHEIGAHARQFAVGAETVGLGSQLTGDHSLPEGLALRYEEAFKERAFGIPQSELEAILFYVFAVRRGEQGGTFLDIFEDQLERRRRMALKKPYGEELTPFDANDPITRTSMERAWRTTYRVTRGHHAMTDLRQPNAKDLVYLRGWIMDRQLRAHGRGHVNEIAALPARGLPLMARIDARPEHVSIPYVELGVPYAQLILAKRAARLSD